VSSEPEQSEPWVLCRRCGFSAGWRCEEPPLPPPVSHCPYCSGYSLMPSRGRVQYRGFEVSIELRSEPRTAREDTEQERMRRLFGGDGKAGD
jgi:hypothetical protein